MKRCLSRRRLCAIALALLAVPLADAASPVSARSRSDREDAPQQELAGKAVLAVVSLARQRISLYDAEGNVLRASISSGQTGYETPAGVFSVLQKEQEHYSNLYDDASMPFMQRITWSGVALHAGALPGYPASHGCVRLPHGFAERIFSQTRLGLRVVISPEDVTPVAVSHPLLLQPEPMSEAPAAEPVRAFYDDDDDEKTRLPDVRGWPARQALQSRLRYDAAKASRAAEEAKYRAEEPQSRIKEKATLHARARKALSSAEAAKAKAEKQLAKAEKLLASVKRASAVRAAEGAKQRAVAALKKADAQVAAATAAEKQAAEALAGVTDAAKEVLAAETAAATAAKDAERSVQPVSLFVSLKRQRLYVRQGNEPVLDVPVVIRDPETPIGTHVFTAVGYTGDGKAARWSVVSVTDRTDRARAASAGDDDDAPRRGKTRRDVPPVPTDLQAATAALDRIQIPDEVRQRLARYVWPGSSLIVSDEDVNRETGKATDFIVVMSDQPQGALKIRPKPKPQYYADDYGYGNGYGYSNGFGYSYPRGRRVYRAPSTGPFSWW